MKWALLVLSFYGFSALAETTFDLFPQGEYIAGLPDAPAQTLAARGILEAKFRAKSSNALFYVDLWGLSDAAPISPDLRDERNVFALQEAYLDLKFLKYFSIRGGRMPIRWSESWTLPSLDFWTGRRWNEFFFLPVSFQLVNPTGLQLNFDNGTSSLSTVVNFIPTQDIYPPTVQPPPQLPESVEAGLRAKTRLEGFDLAAMYARQHQLNQFGGNISYAFDQVVPKIEGGFDNNQDAFGTLGLDIFLGDWSILPQGTIFTSPLLPFEYERIFYLPIRYSTESNTVEMQLYGNLDSYDQFYAFQYMHQFQNGVQLTGYIQNYFGEDGDLFAFYQYITGGVAFGFRAGTEISF